MPIVLLLVVGFIFVMATRGSADVQPKRSLPPPKPLPIKKTADTVHTKTAGKGGSSIETLLRQGATAFAAMAFDSELAQTVATVGFSLAITVALAVNIGIGIIIFVVVEWVAYFIDIADIISDFQSNRSAEGISKYWEEYNATVARFKDAVTVQASTKGQKADTSQLDYAANAYAEGFMEWKNWLQAKMAMSGGIWRNASLTAGARLERAYLTGLVASERYPVAGAFTVNPTDAQWHFQFWGDAAQIWTPHGWVRGWLNLQPSDPHFGTPTHDMIGMYYRIGMAHANAMGFMSALKHPVGIGQSKTSHLAASRQLGYFHGAVIGPPDVPSNVGLTIDGYTFYTPDDVAVTFTSP